MLRPPSLDPAVLNELMSRVGFALWQIQELESTIAHYLVMVHKIGASQARQEAETLLEATRKRTLGQLLGELRGHEVPPELVERLDAFVQERNWLVHRSRGLTRPQVYQASKRDALFQRLDGIAEEALALMKSFGSQIQDHMVSLGISPEEIDRRAAELMRTWVDA